MHGARGDESSQVYVTEIEERRPHAVRLARTLLRPESGGEESDAGQLEDESEIVTITSVVVIDGNRWCLLDGEPPKGHEVLVRIDVARREILARLHTAAHILNSLVYLHFDGALVNGVHLKGDGSGRVDFDLPDADNGALRGLEVEVNEIIRADRRVLEGSLSQEDLTRAAGVIRSLAATPLPDADGSVRVVEIEGFDVQACSGSHVSSTALIGGMRILKVDSKGRHNRRVRFSLEPRCML
jgi:misacylated tRNA(Ala) deacylase